MSFETYTVKNRSKRKFELNSQNKTLKSIKRSRIENIRELLNDNKFNFAYENIINYIEQYGEDCYIDHEYGKYLNLINDIDSACYEYEKNIQNNGENKYYSMYELAKLEKLKSNNEKAIMLLKEILNSKHSEKFHAKYELAKIYFEETKYELAKDLFYEIINMNDDSEILNNIKEAAYTCLVQAEINTENYDKARELIEEYKCYLKDFEYNLLRGQLELHMRNYRKAKEIFDEIVENYNEGVNKALYYLIEIEYKLLNYERVVEICEQLLETNYNTEDTLISLANTYLRMRNTDEAKKCIELLKTYGFLDSVDMMMGKICFYEKNYEDAIEYFNKISSENTRKYVDALYTKICSYVKLNKYEEAYSLLEQFIDADKDKKFYRKIAVIKYYLETKLKLKSNIKQKIYTIEQIESYDKEKAIEHIKTHKSEDEDKPVHSIFNENIDIEHIYDYCKTMINDETFYKNTFLDVYIIPYENAGTLDGRVLNKLKVVTIPNTDKILAIYPFDIPTYESKKIKNKKLSRIDKFNQKYGIK